MTQPFGHEKLIVYQKGMQFAALRGALLARLPRRVAACDHLDRGAESILVNMETAYKATIQSASLVDLATANGVADVSRVEAGRELLRRIAAMLTALSKVAAHA